MCCDARGKSDGQQSPPLPSPSEEERVGVIDKEGPECLFSPVWLPRDEGENEKKGTKLTWLTWDSKG
jgi:hypothetical protein